jgi:endonuclease YncB( thermonuclease family)
MKKYATWLCVFASVISMLDIPNAFSAQKWYWQEGEFTVYEIIDGDTFKVRMNGKIEPIRILWLDTPEKLTIRTGYEECYWKEASEYAWKLLHRKTIRLVSDKTQGYRDKYSRILAHAYLPNGELFSAKMIEGGYGFRYVYGKKVTNEDTSLKTAEKNAKTANIGVWKVCDGVRKKVTKITSPYVVPSSIFDIPRPISVPSGFLRTCSSEKRFCRSMNSCEEAKFHFLSCKVQSLDSDGDGVPCESICK